MATLPVYGASCSPTNIRSSTLALSAQPTHHPAPCPLPHPCTLPAAAMRGHAPRARRRQPARQFPAAVSGAPRRHRAWLCPRHAAAVLCLVCQAQRAAGLAHAQPLAQHRPAITLQQLCNRDPLDPHLHMFTLATILLETMIMDTRKALVICSCASWPGLYALGAPALLPTSLLRDELVNPSLLIVEAPA